MDFNLTKIKFILRENDMPMFSDSEISDFVENSSSIDMAIYEMLLLKSENTTLSISGLTTAETSGYFKRLASMYRPINSGILGGK